ncbi:MAG TPA: DUF1149 family protein [Tetragenococcus sp.]|nr:DUF1149 family protein [Tetragenococcus sp.]
MNIRRQKAVVEAYHFDMKKKSEDKLQTQLNAGFSPLDPPTENYPAENSIIGAHLDFEIVLPQFIIRGAMGQVNHIADRKITKKEDITQAESDELLAPLFDLVTRLTYEVTEIITDEKGITLNFNRDE